MKNIKIRRELIPGRGSVNRERSTIVGYYLPQQQRHNDTYHKNWPLIQSELQQCYWGWKNWRPTGARSLLLSEWVKELKGQNSVSYINNTLLLRTKQWLIPKINNQPETVRGGERDGSTVKSPCCSCRRPRVNSQYPHGRSQVSTTPFSGGPAPSSHLCGHCTHTTPTYSINTLSNNFQKRYLRYIKKSIFICLERAQLVFLM